VETKGSKEKRNKESTVTCSSLKTDEFEYHPFVVFKENRGGAVRMGLALIFGGQGLF
jgi:hypothetical protein